MGEKHAEKLDLVRVVHYKYKLVSQGNPRLQPACGVEVGVLLLLQVGLILAVPIIKYAGGVAPCPLPRRHPPWP